MCFSGFVKKENQCQESLLVQQAFADLERGRGYLVPDDDYKSFDQKRSGRFRLDGFISLCIFVQSARMLN
ncbi:unnamed protein product [Coffea canephora]|uniref:Uncharacterized protein n=1 Tax=Coffea canephora TaxID=49390 RepID=A0A068U741_COFCA|nr:unnamed protein product [Coffea canephora]